MDNAINCNCYDFYLHNSINTAKIICLLLILFCIKKKKKKKGKIVFCLQKLDY